MKVITASLERERAELAEKMRCKMGWCRHGNGSKEWIVVKTAVKTVWTLIPLPFVVWTVTRLEISLCMRLTNWVLDVFGV